MRITYQLPISFVERKNGGFLDGETIEIRTNKQFNGVKIQRAQRTERSQKKIFAFLRDYDRVTDRQSC